ncbi:unnamed protein product [Closterium sp. Naga37s-1]|nr:unnamed protein product [Closterium sp. Naga37s-1]
MDTTMYAGDAAGSERERMDELKNARKALAEARRREEQLEGVVREGGRAMGELEEWVARKVDAMSSLAAVLCEEWLKGAELFRAEGERKRAGLADCSPSHPMMMIEHLAALSGHAEAIRSMVQAVRGLAFGTKGQSKGQQGAGEGRAGDVDRESVGQTDAEERAIQEEVFDNLSTVQVSAARCKGRFLGAISERGEVHLVG